MVLKCIFSDNHLAFCQVKYLEVITCLPQDQGQGMATNKYCRVVLRVPIMASSVYAPCLTWHQ